MRVVNVFPNLVTYPSIIRSVMNGQTDVMIKVNTVGGQIRLGSDIFMDECNESCHKISRTYIITFIHNMHKIYIPDSHVCKHVRRSVSTSQKSIIIIPIAHE